MPRQSKEHVMAQYIRCGASGGPGGAEFVDDWFITTATPPVVTMISAWADESYVHSIQFSWSGHTGTKRGGGGGMPYNFVFDADEFITQLWGRHDQYVKWIGFETNKKKYTIGNVVEQSGCLFAYEACPGHQRIIAPWGRCGDLIDAIGVSFLTE
jgi:hypothetical protein